MAGTRGIATLRGEQLRGQSIRDFHFDVNNKVSENKIEIKWNEHREILEDTKIDVFVQVNDKAVAGMSQIDVTDDVGTRPVSTSTRVEGVVLSEKVQIRAKGTDSPIGDTDADVVYGLIEEQAGTYTLKFYSTVGKDEQPFTFTVGAGNIDYRFVVRTNLSVIPVDAIVNGGSGFVEGATDAKAYMNLMQLMKDIYGASGTLDNDGSANLATNLVTQVSNEVQSRIEGDKSIRDDFSDTTGASLIGVVTDSNYTGLTVQTVLTNLANRLKGTEKLTDGLASRDKDSVNGYFTSGDYVTAEGRIIDLESKTDSALKEQADRLVRLEIEDEEEVYEATGGEAEYNFTKGEAKPKTVLVAINGGIQAPGINFDYKINAKGNIIGLNFAPDTLKVTSQGADILFIKYKKVLQ
ncbi:hypothetical protein [Brevibacillus laterosporus]|uniref:hypothetical protein n=1 Tax=Brevibacillus laterosporus TaxID=1465 RepID=UPI003D20A0B6